MHSPVSFLLLEGVQRRWRGLCRGPSQGTSRGNQDKCAREKDGRCFGGWECNSAEQELLLLTEAP